MITSTSTRLPPQKKKSRQEAFEGSLKVVVGMLNRLFTADGFSMGVERGEGLSYLERADH